MGEPLLLQLFIASSLPIVKILLICGTGAFCARKGLLTPEGRRVLGALSFLVFNPCLIFVKLASTLTPSRLLHWWPLVINTGISTAVGLGLGYLGARLVRPVHHLRPHTIVAIALGNLGNLPLVIVSTLATSSSAVLHGIPPDRAEDLAVSYVVVGLLLPCLAHATIGFSMLRKPNTVVLPEPKAAAAEGVPPTPRTAALVAVARAANDAAAAAASTADSEDDPGPPCLVKLDSVQQLKRQQRQPLLLREELSCGSSTTRQSLPVPSSSVSSFLASGPGAEGAGALGFGASDADGAGARGGSNPDRIPLLTEAAGPSDDPRVGGPAADDDGGAAAAAAAAVAGVAAPRQRGSDPSGPGGQRPHGPEPPGPPGRPSSPAEDWEPGPLAERGPPHAHAVAWITGGAAAEAEAEASLTGGRLSVYGCALDCLGQDGQPLVGQPAGARPEQQGAGEVGLGRGIVRSHSVVELPPMTGARLELERPGSFSKILRSASGRRTLGRLARSTSGRHVLLEWHSRINYRAVLRVLWREAISPPLLAILVSVPVGCVRPVQAAFFDGPGAPLALVTDCMTMLGDCTIPAILILLGATLANGPGAAQVPFRIISLVTATRLVVLPLLGMGLVMGAYAARMFEAPDPIYLLVLLIQNTAPTAILVHTMSAVHGNRAEEVSTILFWGYILGILAIPLWLTLFLFVVQGEYRARD